MVNCIDCYFLFSTYICIYWCNVKFMIIFHFTNSSACPGPDDGTDNSDHEREWEKQQLQKARASTKVCFAV